MFAKFLRQLFRQDWVVYAKPPFGGPDHVLHYLARYTHRVAISNHRLLAFDNDRVTFRWKDYAHGNKKRKMTVSADEFLRRFLLHLLPRGFLRIRHFGILANRCRAQLIPRCRQLLAETPRPHSTATASVVQPVVWACPDCGGPMTIVERLTSEQIRLRLLIEVDLLIPRNRLTQGRTETTRSCPRAYVRLPNKPGRQAVRIPVSLRD